MSVYNVAFFVARFVLVVLFLACEATRYAAVGLHRVALGGAIAEKPSGEDEGLGALRAQLADLRAQLAARDADLRALLDMLRMSTVGHSDL